MIERWQKSAVRRRAGGKVFPLAVLTANSEAQASKREALSLGKAPS